MVRVLQAPTPVLTRVGSTLRDVYLTLQARVAGEASARHVVDTIQTRGVVHTTVVFTIIDVVLASISSEASPKAVARVIVNSVVAFSGVTRIWQTVIDVGFAVGTGDTSDAGTCVAINSIGTRSVTPTWARCTLVNVG